MMQVRNVLSNDRKLNVGPWDWEQAVAHKSGRTDLSQEELMRYLRDDARVEAAQREADEDARINARQLAVDGFLPEAECDAIVARLEHNHLLQPTKSPTLRHLLANCNFEKSSEKPEALSLAHDVAERLSARLRELEHCAGDDGRALFHELRVAPEWSSRDYHVRHAERGMEMRLVGASDYIRVMRYCAPEEAGEGGGSFATDPRNAHHDGRNKRAEGDSLLTALLYLSSEGEGEGALRGGGTLFLDEEGEQVARVAPRKGSLLLFDHHLYHRGEHVAAGVKHVLRSDLLYRPVDARTGEALE